MCQVGTFTELTAGVGVGEGPLFGVGVGVGDGEAAFTPPQPATASTAAVAITMIAVFWRRNDGREEEIWETILNVELTATFMAHYLSNTRKSARKCESFAYSGASPGDRDAVIRRDAAALDRDAPPCRVKCRFIRVAINGEKG
jgi:hypothetical protein